MPQAQPWDDLLDAPPGVPGTLPKQPSEVTIDPNTGRPLVQFHGGGGRGAPLAPWLDLPDQPPPPEQPEREIGQGEAAWTGLKSGLSLGFEPEYKGLAAAGREALGRHLPDFIKKEDLDYLPSPLLAHVGAAKMLVDWAAGHDDPEVQKAHDEGRDFAQKNVDLSKKQHALAFYSGLIGGSLMLPGFGPELGAASAAERVAAGMGAGGLYGALGGTGEAVSRGEAPLDVAKSAGKGAITGAVVGGALHGAAGPREPPIVPTAGQRAATTGERLDAPLPRGIASDSTAINQGTALAQEVPLTGNLISNPIRRFQEAAGGEVERVAQGMGGGGGRTVADDVVRRGIQGMIDRNIDRQNAAYDRLRSMLPQQGDTPMPMPRLRQELDRVVAARRAAGRADPEQGLEQFRNLENGATFNGTHRARTDARNAGNVTAPNPGYDKADYNRLTRAMTGDLREGVARQAQANARNPADVVRAFDEAEGQFGTLAEQNRVLSQINRSGAEGAFAQVKRATQNIGGDARLLQQMRQTMPAAEWQQASGQILSELGTRAAEGGSEASFSLQQFARNWRSMSNTAKTAMFEPAHRQNIDEIVDAAGHIGKALEKANKSHTSGGFIAFETIKTIGELALATGAGFMTPEKAALAWGGLAAVNGATFLLSRPAAAASTRAWAHAWQGAVANPTPARTAIFKVATRNLGNTIGVPAEKIAQVADDASTPEPNKRVEVPIR